MGWSLGHDGRWGKFGRDIGYGVPAVCDHPGCNAEIDRGLAYVCGDEPYGGDDGCGLFFCGAHRRYTDCGNARLCERCATGKDPFEPTPDVLDWVDWKLTDESWAQWRDENPEEAALMRSAKDASQHASDTREAPATEPKDTLLAQQVGGEG